MTESMPQTSQYETVIGLEVHVQLKTQSKLFDCAPNSFGDEPNENTHPVCLGLPGTLPVLNKKALEYAIRLGLGLNCQIAEITQFDRKQYFYPDLPKGYQISQLHHPICEHGEITLSTGTKVRILRAHMEEDAGKLVHVGAEGLAGSDYSLVDLNRAGTPLVEIVSEPDLKTAEEAAEYMKRVQQIVRYLDVCDGNLEEGSMRCDANVSIRPVGTKELGTKTEIKNMNSFRAIQRAIEVEVARQIKVVEGGGQIVQETRLWDDTTQKTKSMRSKEEAHDYRYFPDPDLTPIPVSRSYVEEIRQSLPEMPAQRMTRYTEKMGLSDYDANLLTETKELGDFFDRTLEFTTHAKAVANWLMGDITAYLKDSKETLDKTKLSPENLAELVELLESDTIGSAVAKQLLPELMTEGSSPKKLVDERGLAQMSDEGALTDIVKDVLANNPQQVEQFKAGKEQVIGFLVGQVMKATQGSANPKKVQEIIKKEI